jgi:hypothetical protein
MDCPEGSGYLTRHPAAARGGCGDGLLAGVDQAVREIGAERAWLEGCCQFTCEEHQGQPEFGGAQVVIWFGGDDVADGGGHGCQAGAMLGHYGWPGRGVLPFERGDQGDGSVNRRDLPRRLTQVIDAGTRPPTKRLDE